MLLAGEEPRVGGTPVARTDRAEDVVRVGVGRIAGFVEKLGG